uniref:Light harvesting protein n=1 Tax=Coccolithus braarudii TaxID=221442 RepID=A0A7S0PWE2_9EUKA
MAALALLAGSPAYAPARLAVAHTQPQCRVQMAGPMYDAPLAPSGMGQEFINSERKPLSEYVGSSVELGDKPWDPWSLTELWKVSANNPDVAWLREAELKHGRLSMLAFAGVLATNGGLHLPGEFWTDSDWTTALGSTFGKNSGGMTQIVAAIGIIEGTSSKGLFDLWLGNTEKREPGNLGFDPLKLMPPTPVAADKMRLKELKNGRMAMIAMAGFASNHFIPGSVPGLQGFLP